MSYEINVKVINQQTPVYLEKPMSILLQNEIDDADINAYAEIWSFFSNMQGILYSLVTEYNDGFYSAYEICDSDFETFLSDNEFVKWIPEEDREKLTPFIVKKEFFDDFITILKFLLMQSPQKRILFQTRYQGGDKEIILGVIKVSTFVEMLYEKQVLFNVCYIIEAD